MPANWRCRIINTFGIHDEISAVAKEILLLTGEDNMAFDQIGVVARTLDDYGATIKEIFAQHKFRSPVPSRNPLVQFPLTKAAILLMNLAAKDYPRSHVIDLLSSPYFRLNGVGKRAKRASYRSLGSGQPRAGDLQRNEEWQRIDRYAVPRHEVVPISDDDERRFIEIPAAQLRALATILNSLR